MTSLAPIDANLASLELLRDFKRRMPQARPGTNVTPFDDRVSTGLSSLGAADVGEMHAVVRDHIRETIQAVRDGTKQSQVILLSGTAGVGKTHLVRTFQTSDSMEQFGHVFVGGTNHWKIDEFQAYLLDRVIEALTAPTPQEDHPLLERIRAIGFRTVEHLLNNPNSWKSCLASRGRGFVKKWLRRWSRPSFEQLQKLAAERDPRVFPYFDFAKFANYACDRFLAQRSNLLHRLAFRVLLLYLFPDSPETGVGTRERVLHWFRGWGNDDYFDKRFGTVERPERAYSRIEAVQLLAHLFSPTVSAQLSTESAPCSPRVLLLTFDQVEGRDELFESDGDWKDFFAHLSELYNSLPNVVVLFTMTLGLKARLHGLMERQFRDRIRMDDRFTLTPPMAEQVLSLYRHRVEQWLRDDPDLVARYRIVENPYLPFKREELLQPFRSVRAALAHLDGEFRKKLSAISVDAALDYLFLRNERKALEDASTEWDYTAAHLDTVLQLFGVVGSRLVGDGVVEFRELKDVSLDRIPVVRLVLGLADQPQTVTIHLARLGNAYNAPIPRLIDAFLYKCEKARYFLYVVRPQPLPNALDVVEKPYKDQFVSDICPVAVESAFASLIELEGKRSSYLSAEQRISLDELIRTEVARTYLGRLIQFARLKLQALTLAASSAP